MSPRHKSKKKNPSVSKTPPSLPVLHPHAAGIDIGAREIYVAVPPERDPKPVRCFATFTADLLALRDWLKGCGVVTVAMESTGIYWIPLFQILEAAGLEVCLVNARHCKNLPGRKTDVQDCQWLQYLHAVGLLRGSFRPPETVCAVRSLLRHRDGLVRAAATCVHRLHKALTQMNVQLQHVIADVTGVTGLAMLEALLAGERDPVVLARLKDGRIRASTDTIAKGLRGDWRAEHLFTLGQTLATWKHYQAQITACDEEVGRQFAGFDAKADVAAFPLPARTSTRKSPQKNEPRFEAREELYRTCGVDLTQVPGIQSGTALALVVELGPDFAERFPTAKHFASWLGVCPLIRFELQDSGPWIGRWRTVDQGTVHQQLGRARQLYLAAAQTRVCPGPAKPWLRRQQERLLNNELSKVLRTLRPHQEPEGTAEAPVQAADRSLAERADHLDYRTARQNDLPIGSGGIESGHRHEVQQRLKLPGCWWKESNAGAMLNLRVARANDLWSTYWSSAKN